MVGVIKGDLLRRCERADELDPGPRLIIAAELAINIAWQIYPIKNQVPRNDDLPRSLSARQSPVAN